MDLPFWTLSCPAPAVVMKLSRNVLWIFVVWLYDCGGILGIKRGRDYLMWSRRMGLPLPTPRMCASGS